MDQKGNEEKEEDDFSLVDFMREKSKDEIANIFCADLFTCAPFCREFIDCTRMELKNRIGYLKRNRPVIQLYQRPDEYRDDAWLSWIVPYSFMSLPVHSLSKQQRYALAECIRRGMFLVDDIEHNPMKVQLKCFSRNMLIQRAHFKVARTLNACLAYGSKELQNRGLNKEKADESMRDCMGMRSA